LAKSLGYPEIVKVIRNTLIQFAKDSTILTFSVRNPLQKTLSLLAKVLSSKLKFVPSRARMCVSDSVGVSLVMLTEMPPKSSQLRHTANLELEPFALGQGTNDCKRQQMPRCVQIAYAPPSLFRSNGRTGSAKTEERPVK
jgi:hypothetical protein